MILTGSEQKYVNVKLTQKQFVSAGFNPVCVLKLLNCFSIMVIQNLFNGSENGVLWFAKYKGF